MTDMFYAQIDLEKLAKALTPYLEDRLSGERRKPAANEPDDWPSDPQSNDEADPWSDDPPARPVRESRSQTRSASSKGSSGRSRQSQPRSKRAPCETVVDFPSDGTHTDKFDREWTFDEIDAPNCHGGHIAARVAGQSQAGNDYEVWACPVGFGKSYKKKCDLWDYVS